MDDGNDTNGNGTAAEHLDASEIKSLMKHATKGKSHGRLCISAVDELQLDKYICECCDCALSSTDDVYCLDCEYPSNRAEIELISFLYEHAGDLNDNHYQSKVKEYASRWNEHASCLFQ